MPLWPRPCPLAELLSFLDVVVRQPRFLGSGYIAVPVPRGTSSVPLTVIVSFRPAPASGRLDWIHPSQLLLFSSSESSAAYKVTNSGGGGGAGGAGNRDFF